MFGSAINIQRITFVTSKTVVPGIRTEYYKYETGVKFHFWADPEFPDNFEASVLSALAGFPKDNIIVEYVPEVDSWYGEVKNVSMLNDTLIERVVAKVSKAVAANGEG